MTFYRGAIAAALALQFIAVGPAALAADAASGKNKAQTCLACHGEGGRSVNPFVPSLAGQPPLYVYDQLLQFRDERRKNPIMSPVAVGMKDADMRDMAAYFAQEKPAPVSPASNPELVKAGEKIAQVFHCASCHMPDYSGQNHIARLAGQQRDYLALQLRGFKTGSRPDIDGTMASAAQPLSDQDIDSMAGYLSSFE